MKIIVPVILAIILALGGFAFGFYNGYSDSTYTKSFAQRKSSSVSSSQLSIETKELHLKSFETAKLFAKASILTQMVLLPDPDEVDYQTWQRDLNYVIEMWEEVDSQSQKMVKEAEKVTELKKEENHGLFLIPEAQAAVKFDAKKINAIYDAAPAGKRIRTLAEQLGVDAKRAYKMLKMAQNQVTAEAWNEAGDTFETLENTARVIKDASKVTVYVGGAALSGGSVSTVGTILSEGGAIIGGVDLLFEVGEDVSAIAFGYDDKSVAMLGDLRKITEPAASIIGLAGITNATNAYDRWSAIMFGADQINSAIQEDKYLGIKVNFDDMVIESQGMDKVSMEAWMAKEKIEEEPSEELVKEVLDFSEAEESMINYFTEPDSDQEFEDFEIDQDQDIEVEIDDDTFDFIEQNDTISETDVENDFGPLYGIWRLVGYNSESTIPEEYSYIFKLEFDSDVYCHFEGDDLRRIGPSEKYSFDEQTGTGKIGSQYTLEYGKDKNHLFVRVIHEYGPLKYLYFEKTNEQVY